MTPAVSILCITHRKGELLRATLTGVAALLEGHDELLVIDDGGEDRRVFDDVAAGLPGARLRYVGVPHAGYRLSLLCNIGVMLAAHERIVKIDGDVVPRPGWLATYRRLLGPDVLVCGRIEWRLEDGRLARDSRFDYSRRQGCVGSRKSYGGNLGFMRDDLLALGLFAPEYHGAWGAEDAEIGEKYRISKRAVAFAFDAVAEHQWHPPSPFRRGAGRNRRLLRDRVQAFERGRLPRPVRRDSLHVFAERQVPRRELESLLAGLSLPSKLHQEPPAAAAGRIGPGDLVLLLGDLRGLTPAAVDALYAHLKADAGCRAVTLERLAGRSALVRGAAARRAPSLPWPDARPVPLAPPTGRLSPGL